MNRKTEGLRKGMQKISRIKDARLRLILICIVAVCILFGGVRTAVPSGNEHTAGYDFQYEDRAYEEVNGNRPFFEEDDLTCDAFEEYAPLDELGRCGAAYANVCPEIMPTEERTAIGSVKPSGWHTVKYSGLVDGSYLYNRCHLIAYMLAGENANERNLITGTRYMNVEGMLPFENQVADYVHETGNHVLYRVTPVFDEDNLVADGVLMEAYSVEDDGRGVCFCVFVFNVQPGIAIDYATGESRRERGQTPRQSVSEN